ncbi:recombinase family protein [Streptosporangium sp. V21-05]|uniref:recombinase family protein n=1 Tax=Streptosporangium sp. V21-05 TaxID=3446115 RepID=UPI003F52F204
MNAFTRPRPSGRGRPPSCPPEVVSRVIQLRTQGFSLTEIGEVLNAEGVPTPAGGPRWAKSYVDRLLHTRHAQQEIAMQRQGTEKASKPTAELSA